MQKLLNSVKKYLKTVDLILITLVTLLTGIGLMIIYSATLSLGPTRYIVTQSAAILIGIVGLIILSCFNYERIASFSRLIYILCLIAIAVTLAIGSGEGNRNWIYIGGMSIQPSELIKIGFIITFSSHLYYVKDEINRMKNILLLCLHFGIIVGGILLQDDMGQSLVFIFIFISLMFVAGLKLRYFIGSIIALVTATPFIWHYFLRPYQKQRIILIFNPESDPLKTGWQTIQSKIAIGSGAMWGRGLFKGTQTQYSRVPAKQTDFIFTVIGEELGFVGCLIVILLVIFILIRIIYCSRSAKNDLGSFICIGVFAMFAFQIVVSIGMCIGLVPVIGITFPFLSYGGTSIMCNYFAIGLVMSVNMHKSKMMFGEE